MSADLDDLYRVPLGEFTRTRNELAKRAGPDAAAIRKLSKPNLPAWAVNQLYWQRRADWDRLIRAADALRRAHQKRLAGRTADVDAAEAEHRGAVRAAADEIRGLLRAAGEVASAATIAAVIETLQALPGSAPPGRLTRPLKPMGFDALAGLVVSGNVLKAVPSAGNAAPPEPTARGRRANAKAARAARRAEAQWKRDAARLDADIREARAVERKASSDLARARQALERNERERDHLTEKLQFLEKRLRSAVSDVHKREERLTTASGERAALERRRRDLEPGV